MDCQIFTYAAGPAELKADPIASYCRLAEAAGGQLSALLRDRSDRDADVAFSATERLIPAVREAFGLDQSSWKDVDCMELLNRFMAWLAAAESIGRAASDMAAVYGVGVLSLPYEAYVALWLNLPRQRTQWAVAVAQGLGVASSNDRIDRSFFDAVAVVPAEAAEAEFEANAARAERRILAKRGL